MGRDYLSISKLQPLNRWSLKIDVIASYTLACIHAGFKVNAFRKRGPWYLQKIKDNKITNVKKHLRYTNLVTLLTKSDPTNMATEFIFV